MGFATHLFSALATGLVMALTAPLLHAQSPPDAPSGCQAVDYPALAARDPDSGAPLHHFIGAVHQHSSFSDGFPGTMPRDYYNAGRTACLDFTMGSEHTENEKAPVTTSAHCIELLYDWYEHGPGAVPDSDPATAAQLAACQQAQNTEAWMKWDAHRAQVDEINQGAAERFAAVRGFEWTNDVQNHINVFFSSNTTNAKVDGSYTSMEVFWNWLTRPVELAGGADGLGVFNHPGGGIFGPVPVDGVIDEGERQFSRHSGQGAHSYNDSREWEQYRYVAAADPQMFGVELFNGTKGEDHRYLHGYHGLLDAGWHVSPVGAEDEHGTRWGHACYAKTVIVGSARTPDSLREALERRRTYAIAGDACHEGQSLRSNRDLRLDFRALRLGPPQPAGTIIRDDRNMVTLQARLHGAGQRNYRLELVSNGGEVIASTEDSPLIEHAAAVSDYERWYYVRMVDTSRQVRHAHVGDQQVNPLVMVSAPIWIGSHQAVSPADGGNPWLLRTGLNIAHRGGAAEAPENTLYAYRRAVATGADVLEMDVYESADGELVVIHDSSVDRTTNGTGEVSSLTLGEIKALDAAWWYAEGAGTVHGKPDSAYVYRGVADGSRPPPPGSGPEDFRIPTMREILQAFPDVMLVVELKPNEQNTGSYEARLARLLREFGRGDDVIVASFLDHHSGLFKIAAPEISTSVPTTQVAAFWATSQGALPGVTHGHQAFQVPPQLGVQVVSEDFVRDAHALGLAVHVWTINDCPTMVRMLELGVDGIMSDRPTLLQQVLMRDGAVDCETLE